MIPTHLKVHSVTIADFQGSGTYGDTWGTPRTVKCWVEETNKIVTNALGEQEVSTTQVLVDPGDEGPLKSRITLNGVARTLIAVTRHTSGGLTQLDHVELMLR